MRWLNEHLSADAVKNLVENPLLLCYLLKEFGNHLFSTGKSLHVFSHLVVFTQKHFLETRQFMSINWGMVARWERLEPPVHRTPIPGSVARAMVSVAFLLQWRRFAASLCLAFFRHHQAW